MTVLAAIQEACGVIPLRQPSSVFGSSDREALELQRLANTVGRRIARAYEWQELTTLATINGNGATTAFALPADYYKMPRDTKLWSSKLEQPYSHIMSLDAWLEMEVRSFNNIIGRWIIIGNMIEIRPAPASGETINYYYLSNNFVTSAAGPTANIFAADGDTFRLSETLLALAMIWQWRANKGLPYAENMQDYEDEKEREIAKNRGPRLLLVGEQRLPVDAVYALPIVVTP